MINYSPCSSRLCVKYKINYLYKMKKKKKEETNQLWNGKKLRFPYKWFSALVDTHSLHRAYDNFNKTRSMFVYNSAQFILHMYIRHLWNIDAAVSLAVIISMYRIHIASVQKPEHSKRVHENLHTWPRKGEKN